MEYSRSNVSDEGTELLRFTFHFLTRDLYSLETAIRLPNSIFWQYMHQPTVSICIYATKLLFSDKLSRSVTS